MINMTCDHFEQNLIARSKQISLILRERERERLLFVTVKEISSDLSKMSS
jgi:hypothetical protein